MMGEAGAQLRIMLGLVLWRSCFGHVGPPTAREVTATILIRCWPHLERQMHREGVAPRSSRDLRPPNLRVKGRPPSAASTSSIGESSPPFRCAEGDIVRLGFVGC